MMDLTPLEVRKKKGDFRRQIRGYDPESVDDFLDLVADRMEVLVRENAALTESSTRLEQQVGEWKEREKALTEALVSAQQMREEMRSRAQKDAQAARSEAEKYAEEHRTKAAHEAEEARREAQATLRLAQEQATTELDEARAKARRELEEARATAHAALVEARTTAETELARIRTELERARSREQATIAALQERRANLVASYRALLEQERTDLENLPVEEETTEAEAESIPDLPTLSPALLAAIEAAEAEVEVAWTNDAAEQVASFTPEQIEAAAPPRPAPAEASVDPQAEAVAESRHADADRDAPDAVEPEMPAWAAGEAEEGLLLESEEPELVLDGPVDDGDSDDADEDTWLSNLVADSEAAPAPQPAPVTQDVERAAIEAAAAAESDEDFIDTLIARAGVAPAARNGDAGRTPSRSPSPAPSPARAEPTAEGQTDGEFLGDLLRAELETEEAAAEEEIDPTEGFDELDLEPATIVDEASSPAEPARESGAADDLAGDFDGDEDFDALFEDGDDDPATFDFDAALANATGVTGRPDGKKDREAAFDLGVEFDDASPLDLGRGGAGAFGVEDLGRGPYSPSNQPGLTLRPLSPEEEAPDLPIESRRNEENDDDMFSTMFGGR